MISHYSQESGKALKDWATRVMKQRGVTRAEARKIIIERIKDTDRFMSAREKRWWDLYVPIILVVSWSVLWGFAIWHWRLV